MMVKLQELVFPPSVAVHVTTVVPTAKALPEAGEQTMATFVQLSLAVGVKLTTAEHAPGVVLVVIFSGQVIDGGAESITVTVNEHVDEFVHSFVALQVTVVMPSANVDPDGG